MKAFMSFDTLFSILPIVLIVTFTFSYAHAINKEYTANLHVSKLHNKLVSVADVTVTKLAAKKDSGLEYYSRKTYPNWVDQSELDRVNREELKETLNLKELFIGWEKEGSNCIYRVVVFGDEKEIRQLFVCGA